MEEETHETQPASPIPHDPDVPPTLPDTAKDIQRIQLKEKTLQ